MSHVVRDFVLVPVAVCAADRSGHPQQELEPEEQQDVRQPTHSPEPSDLPVVRVVAPFTVAWKRQRVSCPHADNHAHAVTL